MEACVVMVARTFSTAGGRRLRRPLVARAALATATLAGSILFVGTASASPTTSGGSTGANVISRVAGIGAWGRPTPGPALSSKMDDPNAIAVDASGNVYIADGGNNEVEKVTPGGTLSIIAGTGTSGLPTAGPATSSELNGPDGVAVDSSGNVYIADTGNNVVEKVTPGGTLSIIAGTTSNSVIFYPEGVAVDSSGNVYIADTGNNVVEKVTPGGTLSTIAGTGASGAPSAGSAVTSKLSRPQDVSVDSSGNVYIADTGNNVVEKVTSGGTLSIIAGTGASGVPTPGTATAQKLNAPGGVALDSSGSVYIADTSNNLIEKVTPQGMLSIVAGNGSQGSSTTGLAADSPFGYPVGVAVDASGAIYVADWNWNWIDKIVYAFAPGAPTKPSATVGNGEATVSFTSPTSTGGTPITGYTVTATDTTQSSRGGQTQSDLASPITIGGLTVGDTYSFTVTATNVVGTGASSSASSPVVIPGVPGAPTKVQVSPRFEGDHVSWTPPTSTGGTPITGYQIYENPATNDVLVGSVSASKTSFDVTGLTPWSNNSFVVEAINKVGPSAPSSEVSANADSKQLTAAHPALVLGSSLHSANNAYELILQSDGNLVEYHVTNGSTLFETKTYSPKVATSRIGHQLTLTKAGKLQLVSASGQVLWTPTSSTGSRFVIQDSGKMQLLSASGTVVWSS